MFDRDKLNKQLIKVLKEQVEASPTALEAYNLADQGDWDGIIALYERDAPNWPKPENEVVACKKGCSLCCSLNVDIMDYEKPTLKKAIEALDDHDRQNVFFKAAAKNKITKGMNEEDRANKRYVCPLLHEHECVIYKDRPLSCKGFNSLDYDICIEGSVPNSDVQMKSWASPMEHKIAVEMGAGLHQLEYGGEIPDMATTLESFIDDELNK